jgi:hypothetical protein
MGKSSAIFVSRPDPDFAMVIAAMFAIEKPIRIDRDPVFIFKPDPDFFTPGGTGINHQHRGGGSNRSLLRK